LDRALTWTNGLGVSTPYNGSKPDIGAFEFASAAPMQIMTSSLPNAIRLRYYNQTLQALGGSGNYVWSITLGTLPPGLWLDTATGVVRGRARLKGTWNFTLTVQDSQNVHATASRAFSMSSRLYF
ncbi:MAG: Ig domain-containing protein, partial [Pyrinomonadaceae bacterium]